MSTYCWDGVSDSATPTSDFEPSIPGVKAADQVGGAGTVQTPTPSVSASGVANGAVDRKEIATFATIVMGMLVGMALVL